MLGGAKPKLYILESNGALHLDRVLVLTGPSRKAVYGSAVRIGEILIQHGWLDEEACAVAVVDQLGSGLRLCSLLVSQGEVTYDHASRALGEQHEVAAVLRRHLAGRDRSVASLLPPDFAREHVVLPIGRLGDGKLIVGARDPSPALRDALVKLLGSEIVLAVAPASYLERAVEQTYADVDIPIDIDEEAPADEIVVEVAAPKSRSLPVEIKATRRAPRDSLESALGSFSDIDDRAWLLDVVMGYLETHWSAAMLLEIRDNRRAIGLRGHGRKLSPLVMKTLVLDLDETRFLRRALDERRVTHEPPTELGSDDEQLVIALDTDAFIVAPIMKGADVGFLLVVAEPLAAGHDDAVADLGLLADALGEALARLD